MSIPGGHASWKRLLLKTSMFSNGCFKRLGACSVNPRERFFPGAPLSGRTWGMDLADEQASRNGVLKGEGNRVGSRFKGSGVIFFLLFTVLFYKA